MDIGGRANPSIVSLKQRVWGLCAPKTLWGYLILFSTKIPYNARLEYFKAKFIRSSNVNGVN